MFFSEKICINQLQAIKIIGIKVIEKFYQTERFNDNLDIKNF
jgi:hypothetical protein